MRAELVRQIAYLYIDNHMEDLMKLRGAQEIHAKMQHMSVRQSLKCHVGARIQQHFPPEELPMPEGAVMPEFYEMVRDTDAASNKFGRRPRLESAFESKQSTMPGAEATDINNVFRGVWPNLVLDEASVDNTLPQNLQTEYALSQVAGTTVEMPNKFEDQFVSRYLSSIFPWALNYGCGGPEYPELFKLQALSDMEVGSTDAFQLGVATWWRRLQDAPVVTPSI